MFVTDKIARKSFCVGGLFYPIINISFKPLIMALAVARPAAKGNDTAF